MKKTTLKTPQEEKQEIVLALKEMSKRMIGLGYGSLAAILSSFADLFQNKEKD